MKKINSLSLALTYAGCFLGAGYVSGQELFQFFSSYGKRGIAGFALAILLHIIFGIFIILTVMNTRKVQIDEIVVPFDNKPAKTAVGFITAFFMFGVFIIMIAGFGALFEQVFSVPAYIGNLVFCILITVPAMKGAHSIIKVFSLIVPVLVVFSVIISFAAIIKSGGIPEIKPQAVNSKGLLSGSALLSGFTYVSYNILSSVGILVPLGAAVKDRKTVKTGIALGSVLLFVIGIGIILAMFAFPTVTLDELPMLSLSKALHPAAGYVYAFLLFGGIFGTSLSSLFGTAEYIVGKRPKLRPRYNFIVCAVCAAAYVASLAGFGDLIGVIYPFFGYIGFLILALVAVSFFRSEKREGQ